MAQKELVSTVPFTITTKKFKYLGINLTKDVRTFYDEKHKILQKEIEKTSKHGKSLPCLQIGRINILKISTLLKAIYGFNIILIKIPMIFFLDLEKQDAKIHMEV